MKLGMLAALAICLAAGGALAKPHKARRHADEAATAPRGDPVGAIDGSWTIETTTSVGSCPALIPDALQISGNNIAAAPGAAVATWGYVEANGAIVARFTTEGGRVTRFHGQLRGAGGSGAWSSSTDLCGGTWRATRSQAAAQ